MAFKRAHHRAAFDTNLSTPQVEAFIDDVFDRCEKSNIDGLIIENDGAGSFILEGDAAQVDVEIDFLENANELLGNDTYLTETSGPVFSCLASHVDGDARDSTC